jgi:hypothetical protein
VLLAALTMPPSPPLLLLLLLTSSRLSNGDDEEYRLMRHLLRNYDRRVRPSLNASESLNVTFGLALAQIIDVVSEFCRQSKRPPLQTTVLTPVGNACGLTRHTIEREKNNYSKELSMK